MGPLTATCGTLDLRKFDAQLCPTRHAENSFVPPIVRVVHLFGSKPYCKAHKAAWGWRFGNPCSLLEFHGSRAKSVRGSSSQFESMLVLPRTTIWSCYSAKPTSRIFSPNSKLLEALRGSCPHTPSPLKAPKATLNAPEHQNSPRHNSRCGHRVHAECLIGAERDASGATASPQSLRLHKSMGFTYP